jgi:hypothetical protein
MTWEIVINIFLICAKCFGHASAQFKNNLGLSLQEEHFMYITFFSTMSHCVSILDAHVPSFETKRVNYFPAVFCPTGTFTIFFDMALCKFLGNPCA